jgi:hypothetical protein
MATGVKSSLQTNAYHYSRIKLDWENIQLKFEHFPSLVLSIQQYPFSSLVTPHSKDHLCALGELIHAALEPFLKYISDPHHINAITAAFLSSKRPDPWALALVYPEYIFPSLLHEANREKRQRAWRAQKDLVEDVRKSLLRFWIVRVHIKEWRTRRPGDERIAVLEYVVYCVVEGQKESCLRKIQEMVTGREWAWWRRFEEYQELPSNPVGINYTIA